MRPQTINDLPAQQEENPSSMDGFLSGFRSEVERLWMVWRYEHPEMLGVPFRIWWRLVVKRLVDVAGTGIGLILTAPLFAVVALAIKCDSSGPVIYRQQRLGRFGQCFTLYKFRTMHQDAERATGPVWASGIDDPRLTRIGGWLRRTHLDELPQIVNVLTGEMSLVGPRPERPEFLQTLEQAIPDYETRLLVKPGITGLAQVHYRYDRTLRDVQRKLRFDLLYIKRMCLMLDMRILARTCLVVVLGRGIRHF